MSLLIAPSYDAPSPPCPRFPLPSRSSHSETAALAAILAVAVWQFAYLTTAIKRMYFAAVTDRFAARARAFGVAVVVYLLNDVLVTMGWLAIREL